MYLSTSHTRDDPTKTSVQLRNRVPNGLFRLTIDLVLSNTSVTYDSRCQDSGNITPVTVSIQTLTDTKAEGVPVEGHEKESDLFVSFVFQTSLTIKIGNRNKSTFLTAIFCSWSVHDTSL